MLSAWRSCSLLRARLWVVNRQAVNNWVGFSPAAVRSCHTGTIGGYVIEGHVPAADIKRLLIERPQIVGLAVPGMPAGSPGMEVPSGTVAPYDVLAFDKMGKTTVFASHR